MNIEITREIASRVLAIVDVGLVKGVGVAEPGKMCVEAAVCYALNLPHGDDPQCVSPVLRSFKIRLNDSSWSSDKARAKGLRRLALAQLGSAGHLDEKEFVRRVVDLALRKALPVALRAAASIQKDPKHQAALMAAAKRCEEEGTREAALAAKKIAYAAADAAAYAAADDADAAYAADAKKSRAVARDKVLSEFAEDVVQILIEMKAPGCQWLDLAQAA